MGRKKKIHDMKGYMKEYGRNWKVNHKIKIKEYNKKYREIHKQKQYYNPEYQREYFRLNKKKLSDYMKEWRKNNPKKLKEYCKKYNWSIYTIKYLKNHPEETYKVNARNIAKTKIKINNQICENCKMKNATDRHHTNYNEPLKIILLCKQCHRNIHKKS